MQLRLPLFPRGRSVDGQAAFSVCPSKQHNENGEDGSGTQNDEVHFQDIGAGSLGCRFRLFGNDQHFSDFVEDTLDGVESLFGHLQTALAIAHGTHPFLCIPTRSQRFDSI